MAAAFPVTICRKHLTNKCSAWCIDGTSKPYPLSERSQNEQTVNGRNHRQKHHFPNPQFYADDGYYRGNKQINRMCGFQHLRA